MMLYFRHVVVRILAVLFIATFALSYSSGQQITLLPKDKQEDVDRYLELVERYKQAGNLQQAIYYINRVAFTYWENGDYAKRLPTF